MKNKLFKKYFVVGVIFLFLVFISTINAETTSYNNKSIKSSPYILLNNFEDGDDYPYFAILSMRGTIKDLEILEEHHYHFNATHVVSKGFMIEFLWGYIPIPFYKKNVYNNEEVYVYLKPCNIFNYEKITENYINYFGICYV